MKSRAVTWMVVLTTLSSSGFILDALRPSPPNQITAGALTKIPPDVDPWFAWLGGFRALAADFVWLRLQTAWESRDVSRTQRLISATTTLDPRPLYFWLNGARMLAYDLPNWRIEAEGGYEVVPLARQRAIDEEQTGAALQRLSLARKIHPESAALWIERANIELNRLHDIAAAAESYRQAWLQPNAPFYTARLHGEMLRRLGRKAEAYAWLRTRQPQLPENDEAAGAGLVLVRIRDLERELATPEAETYHSKRE